MKLLTPKYFLVMFLILISANPVLAQSNAELTRAEVYKLQKLVDLLLANKPARRAQLKDSIRPLDAVQTKARSRVDLLFNEGTAFEVGANSIFRFKPGLRRVQLKNGQIVAETIFELQEGTIVAIIPPGGGVTTVEIPGSGRVESSFDLSSPTPQKKSNSDSFFVAKKLDVVSIGNFGSTPIKVFNQDGTQFKNLESGKTLDIKNGVLGDVKTFDLGRFYSNTKLGAALGPGQENLLINQPPQVQETFRAVRKDTIAAWQAQQKWIEGLCTLNGRGVASTLSSNCINTNSDDPLRTFEDRRDVVVPPRQEPQIQPPITEPPITEPPVTEPPVTEPPTQPRAEPPTQPPNNQTPNNQPGVIR
ncbi:hypothetical protein Cal6303_4160 [Calothrix sp. PCC 6303]|nr:hypothetical protein Cal6303_4160 [Calothrix sp. PCC 6303]